MVVHTADPPPPGYEPLWHSYVNVCSYHVLGVKSLTYDRRWMKIENKDGAQSANTLKQKLVNNWRKVVNNDKVTYCATTERCKQQTLAADTYLKVR